MKDKKYLYQFILSLILFLCIFYGSIIISKLKINNLVYYLGLFLFFIISLKIIKFIFI